MTNDEALRTIGAVFARNWQGTTVRRRVTGLTEGGDVVMEITTGRCAGRVVTLDAQECKIYGMIAVFEGVTCGQ